MAPDNDKPSGPAAAPAGAAGGEEEGAGEAPPPPSQTSPAPTSGGRRKKKKRAPIVYRWIGPGRPMPDGTVAYDQLEIRVGGLAALIKAGDCALLCSGDVEEDALYEDEDDDDEEKAAEGGDDGGAQPGPYGSAGSDRNEEEDHYGALDGDDVAVNKLDPFVARVEAMWEEPPDRTERGNRKRSRDEEILVNYDERRSRMKIKARWFYKKEDIEGLMSNFVGVSRADLLETMTPRELILGDQADENEISTILGKCRVVRRRPLDKDADGRVVRPVDDLPTGAFACRYSLNLQPPARAGSAGAVVFSPYDGVDEGIDGADETGSSVGGSPQNSNESGRPASNKRRRVEDDGDSSAARQSAAADPASDAGSGGRGGRGASEGEATSGKNDSNSSSTSSSDDDEDMDASDMGSTGKPDSKRAPTSEGSQLHGSILVGPSHQATIPPLDKKSAIRSRNPALIWEPGSISDEDADEYLAKAASILRVHMEKNGMDFADTFSYAFLEEESTGETTANEGKDSTLGAGRRKPRALFRECNTDRLLSHLHDCKYDVQTALDSISKSPEDYLAIWTRREKELYNSGFRKYYGGLRTISKGIGKSKSFKDVVDYHYRFKIPEQFCKYKDKKREQARRIMEAVEKQRLHAAMVEDGEEVPGAKGGVPGAMVTPSGGKKTRNLSKTAGGSPHSIGKIERRRILARELLSVIRDTIGNDGYLKICRLLKNHHTRTRADPSRKSSITNLKERASDLLGDHPELLERWIEFLPKKHRS